MDFFFNKLYYLWALVAGLGAVVFGAGVVVEKTRTERFVTKDLHAADLKTNEVRYQAIQDRLNLMQNSLDKITNWIDEVRQ